MKTFSLLLIGLFLFAMSCVTPYDPKTLTLEQKLVVDGMVTDQPGRNNIVLTFTADYTIRSLNLLATQATVYVMDNTNQRIDYREVSQGFYGPVNTEWKGQAGRSYTLFIRTSDGRQYQSSPQLLKTVPPIDSVYYEFTQKPIPGTPNFDKGLDLYVDTRDPATPGDYYRWNWLHYEPLIYCRTQEVQAGGQTVIYGYNCCENCWDIVRCYTCNNVAADTRVNGNKISRQPIMRVPYTSTSRYYVEIEQQSLTADGFQYWNTVAQLTQNNGGIFDATPVPLKGNITCTNRENEPAFGFFGASGVSVKALFVNRSGIPVQPNLVYPQPVPPPGPPAACARCVESAYRTPKTPRFWTY